MESLYRKYRPLTFESVVGQQHIVSTLENAVTEGRLSHAYLFCGPRGTGKTTMARILAKSLLCRKAADAPAGQGCLPDGSCPECEAIAAGTHPDVYELDAASRTGVDNVREEIVNSVGFAPVRGKYKVYIIDEVHMLTTAAFNALLKTLEEPPSHVVFVLCTTDPQKVLDTILSRCQRFDFHRIGNDDIIGRLRHICEQENFEFDDEALEIVAKHARGGMRDALSTLEQLSVFGAGSVRASDARQLLGEVSGTVLARFARGIAARDVVGLFGLVREQVDEGNDLMELTRDLVAHMRDVYTVRVAGAKPGLVDGTPDELAALGEEAGLFESADRLARTLTVLDDAALEMRDAADARLVLEISLTRLARPEADLTLEALAERIERLEAQLAAGVPSAPMDVSGLTREPEAAGDGLQARPASQAKPAGGKATPAEEGAALREISGAVAVPQGAPARMQARPAAQAEPAKATGTLRPGGAAGRTTGDAPVAAPRPAGDQRAHPEQQAAPGAGMGGAAAGASGAAAGAGGNAAGMGGNAAGQAGVATADEGELQRKWAEVVKRVTAAQASRGALLQSSRAQSDDGERLVVGLPAGSGFALKMLGRPDSTELITPIACAVFGNRAVEYTMAGAEPQPTPQPVPARAQARPAGQAEPAKAAGVPRPAGDQKAHPERQAAPGAGMGGTATGANSAAAEMGATVAGASSAMPGAGGTAAGMGGTEVGKAGVAVSAADQMSGPTIVPEPDVDAQRAAWESEQVPYDDDVIASYVAEEPEPAPPAAPTPASAPVPEVEATPWAAAPAVPAVDGVPQTEEDAKALLGDIFGAGVIFKSE